MNFFSLKNKINIQTKLLQRYPKQEDTDLQDHWMRNRSDQINHGPEHSAANSTQLLPWFRNHPQIHPSQMNTSGFLQPICWDVTHPNQQVSIWDIADIMYFGCIYLLVYIDGVDEYRTTQKITVLALNLCSTSISGVFPNTQDHRIQFIVENYEADPHNRFA